MRHSLFYFLLVVLSLTWHTGRAQSQNKVIPDLIPYPQSVTLSEGRLRIPENGVSLYSDASALFSNEIVFLKSIVLPERSFAGGVREAATMALLKDFSLSKEAYRLEIDTKGVRAYASGPEGMFNALQTLRQLKESNQAAISLPYIRISDKPAFQWRGIELDVARHFFSKKYLFRFIDLLAYYKFNKLHLHLSDDQGWRIEIKKYPRLTEMGAWRELNDQDSACLAKAKDNPDFALQAEHIIERGGKQLYGGYYTQADMREIIVYAESRHIEVIPEIDMPGHMMIATKAYPELIDMKAGWGKQFSIPLNPAKPQVYTFVQGVLQEIMNIFPSRYVHIGADEVEKSSWEQSALCQALMKQLGLKHVNGLQSYFVNRVNNFVLSKGKRSIAWDEVLDGGADPSIHIMYWRGWVKDGPQKAVQRNHPLIMSPTNPMYFDYLPNKSTLAAVYDFKVIPDDIPSYRTPQVMGAQGNVWTEMIPSVARLEFMILPRMTALAERVWTNKDLWAEYSQRLADHYSRWDSMGYKYRLPDLEGFADEQVLVNGGGVLHIDNPLPGSTVHYSVDGSIPDTTHAVFEDNLIISKPSSVRFAAFSARGARSEIYQVNFRNSEWKQSVGEGARPGLHAEFIGGVFKDTRSVAGDVLRSEQLKNVYIPDTLKLDAFAARLRGFIKVPEEGIYSFFLTCDDGGVLKIADELIVDNDGQHPAIVKSGQVALKAGAHAFAIDFIEAGGGFTLKLSYSLNGGDAKPVPDNWFSH